MHLHSLHLLPQSIAALTTLTIEKTRGQSIINRIFNISVKSHIDHTPAPQCSFFLIYFPLFRVITNKIWHFSQQRFIPPEGRCNVNAEHSPLAIIYILFLLVKYYSQKIKIWWWLFFSSILGILIKLLHTHISFSEKQFWTKAKKEQK